MTPKKLEEKGWTKKEIQHLRAWSAARKRGADGRTAFKIADLEVGKLDRRRPRVV